MNISAINSHWKTAEAPREDPPKDRKEPPLEPPPGKHPPVEEPGKKSPAGDPPPKKREKLRGMDKLPDFNSRD
jgi:hypothetical protein